MSKAVKFAAHSPAVTTSDSSVANNRTGATGRAPLNQVQVGEPPQVGADVVLGQAARLGNLA